MAIQTSGLPANSVKTGSDPEGANSTIAVDAASNGDIGLPSGQFAADASYLHQGDDLVLIGPDGASVVVSGYFLLDNPPDLVTPEGGRITAALVHSFTPPESAGQYAQAGQIAQAAAPIGQVKDISGQVFAVRADGTRVLLTAGDSIYQGDVIETGADGAVNLLFLDETTFALGDSARLALDEMVYNPETLSGSSSFSMLKGVFVFVSGQIAQTDNTQMTVTTPVATIGIRGTTVAGDIKPSGERSLFTVVDGEIAVITQGGTVVMTDQNATTFVTSFLAPPSSPIVFTPNQMNSNYGSVRNISDDYGRGGDLSEIAPGAGGEGDAGGGGGTFISLTDGALSIFGDDGTTGADSEGEGSGGFGEELADDASEGDEDSESESASEEEELAALLEEDDTDGEGEGEGGETVIGASGLPVAFDGSGSTEPQSFTGGDGGEEITGGSGNDLLAGVGGGDVINGGGGNDTLSGGAGNDTVTGGTGNDTIIAATGSGDDFYDGGEDIDTIVYSSATTGVTIDLAAGTAIGDASVGSDLLTGIELVIGGSGNDVFFGSGGDDGFIGAGGDDTAFGRGGADFLTGGVGNDVLNGGAGADILTGDDGNDILVGGSGNDTVLGGAGDDTLIGGGGSDTYDGGAGIDTLSFTNTSSALTFDLSAGTVVGDTSQNFEPEPLELPFEPEFSVSLSVDIETAGVLWEDLGDQGGLLGLNDADSASPDGTSDHFDGALAVRVGGNAYVAPESVGQVGNTFTGNVQTLCGLNVVVDFDFDGALPVARQIVTLTNASGSDISTTVSWINNTGNDSGQRLVGTSSGDLVADLSDRHIVTSDTSDTSRFAEVNTWIMYGPDAPAVTTSGIALTENEESFGFAGDEGLTADFNLTIAAGETRYLMWFVGINGTNQAGRDLAAIFDNTENAQFLSLVSDLS